MHVAFDSDKAGRTCSRSVIPKVVMRLCGDLGAWDLLCVSPFVVSAAQGVERGPADAFTSGGIMTDATVTATSVDESPEAVRQSVVTVTDRSVRSDRGHPYAYPPPDVASLCDVAYICDALPMGAGRIAA